MSESGAPLQRPGEEEVPLPIATPSPAACKHDFAFEADLQQWVCRRCGRSLDLVAKHVTHECGPDCEEHEEVAGLG